MNKLNYTMAEYPQTQYKFRLFDNVKRLDFSEIMEKTPGCVGIINTSYFALADLPGGIRYFDHQSALMIGGNWACAPLWHEYGPCIDKNGKMTLGTEKDAVCDYAVACPPAEIDGKPYNPGYYGKNGVSYSGLKADGTVVCLLSKKDDGMTSTEAVAAMKNAGCIHIFRWDGSWSAQGSLGGEDVRPSQQRTVRTWMLIIDKNKEGKPVRKKVCIDPGHGAGSVNCSPDKSYYEYEFAWDLWERMRPMLEVCGFDAKVTRRKDNKPELIERCKVSNDWGADLFVSLHSNAVGAGAWVPAVGGLLAMTSVAGDTAPRNVAARCILIRLMEAGVVMAKNHLLHDRQLTVLAKTAAPAVLVEYGFHTNQNDLALLKSDAYRQKLAEETVRGICDFFGLPFVPPTPEKPPQEPVHWYDEDRTWAMKNGISDGSRPEELCTRAEVWSMLRRAHEMKGGE